MTSVTYLHLPPGSPMPGFVVARPYKAVIAIEADVTYEWRKAVSEWLVATGCLYTMAWGRECVEWDDSVDYAKLEKFNWGDIPEEDYLMTTWHERETLDEVFWFAKTCATHDHADLSSTLIVDIGPAARQAELLALFTAAN
jgi:hypothetical protein